MESLLTAMQFTYLECSAIVLIQFPCRSNIFMVLSMLHVSNNVPRTLNLKMPVQMLETPIALKWSTLAKIWKIENILNTSNWASVSLYWHNAFSIHCGCSNNNRITTKMFLSISIEKWKKKKLNRIEIVCFEGNTHYCTVRHQSCWSSPRFPIS